MPIYTEETGRREGLGSQEGCRRKMVELFDSGKVSMALSVLMMKPEPGVESDVDTLAIISDGVNVHEARKLLRYALGAMLEISKREADKAPPEPMPEAAVAEAHGRLAEQWLRYASMMELDRAPPSLYPLLRKTFYAGIAVLYTELVEAGNGMVPPAKLVEALHEELKQFCFEEMMEEEPESAARH